MRVRQWWYFLALPLAGWDRGAPLAPAIACAARGLAIAFCVLAFGYLLNAVADRDMDHDRRKNPLVGTSPRSFTAPIVALVALALALAATGSLTVQLATATSLASGFVYSAGPRLKAVPLVGTWLNVMSFGPLLAVGTAEAAPPHLVPVGAAFAALLVQNQLIHEAADAAEDRDGGVQTTFVVLGQVGVGFLALLAGAAVAWATLGLPLGPISTVVAVLVFAGAFPALLVGRCHDAVAMRSLRRLHRVAAAATCALALGSALLA